MLSCIQIHIYALLLFLMFYTEKALSIDCFKCVSMNGSNPACDDPFHNNFSSSFFESPCMGGRKHRDGLFPATSYKNGTRITVRGCALDSGTLTTDTEIVRMSHCGGFEYDGGYVRGCLQSCDLDGCNRSGKTMDVNKLAFILIISIVFMITR